MFGQNSPGVLYQYRNEADKMDIVSGTPSEIAGRISDDLSRRNENLAVVLVGVDELWDVALLKFIHEYTSSSAMHNAQEFSSRGLLTPQPSYGDAPMAVLNRNSVCPLHVVDAQRAVAGARDHVFAVG